MKKQFLLMVILIGFSFVGWGQNASATWGPNASTVWYSGSNWIGGYYAGIQGNPIANSYIATFTNAYLGTSPGINMSTGSLNLGGISIDNTRSTAVNIGNSSTVTGVLRLYGSTINNINNVIIRNNGTGLLTLQAVQAGTMGIVLGNGTENIIIIDNSGGVTISAVISNLSGAANLTKGGNGSGVLILTNTANTYSGNTSITKGELRLNPVTTSATFCSQIVLNGGVLSTTNINSNTVITSSATLKVDAVSTLSLGSNLHTLKFAASNAITWNGTLLTISGWTGIAGSGGTAGKLFIGSNSTGLTPDQLLKISFTGFPPGALILSTGEITPASNYPPPTYYSRGNLAPDLTSSWNSNRDGSSGTTPSNFTSGAVFAIQNGHSMTTSAPWAISGFGSKLQIENGGTLTASYAVSLDAATTFQIDNGGTYVHNNTGTPTIFSGTENFAGNSTVEIKNWVNPATPVPVIDGSWGNLKISWNPGSLWNQSGNITTISGNFILDNSSVNGFCFTGNAGLNLTINGDLNLISGVLNFSNAGSTTNTFILNLGGSYNQAGGTFSPNVNSSSTLAINFNGSGKTFTQTGILITTQINWILNSCASITLNNNLSVAPNRTFTVNGLLDFGLKAISGSGVFTLSSGASLKTANSAGLNGSLTLSGSKTLNPGANYSFNGIVAQVTGDLLPTTVNNFTVDNAAGVTLSNTSLIISGNLCINNGKLFTIESGKQLTVSGTTTLNCAECLVLKSDVSGTSSFIDNGIFGSGTTRIERYISENAWHYTSVPIVSTSTFPFTDLYVKYYTESNNSFHYIIRNDSNLTVKMTGYAIFSDPNTTGNKTIAFTGSLNTGAENISLTSSGSTDNDGWNLVGNPYPSAIDWTLPGWTKTNVDNAIYFYNGTGYSSYIAGVSTNGGSKFIPSMQGFFVHATGSGVLGTTNAIRVHNSTDFYKENSDIENLLRLQVQGNGFSDETYLRFIPEATQGFDPEYDAYKLMGIIEAPQIYSTSKDSKLSINSQPFAGINTLVPVGIQFGLSDHLLLTVSNMGSFAGNITFILEDKKLNVTQSLNDFPVYSFNHLEGENPDRFLIHINNPSFGISDKKNSDPIQIYSYEGTIFIKLQEQIHKGGNVDVFDLTGKLLFSKKLSSQTLDKFNPNLTEGTYIVKVVTDQVVTTAKVTLE